MNDKVNEISGEDYRAELLKELDSELGGNWREEYKAGTFGCHELLDRSMLMATMVEEDLLHHPACILQPDLFAEAEKAVELLHAFYQKVGARHLPDEQA